MEILREITPLTPHDCFTIFSREKEKFDFPIHTHDDIELNLILNAPGAQRIIGDHIGEIGSTELVLVGSNLAHGWFTHNCAGSPVKEVTVQFHKDLFDERFLNRNQMANIRNMFENAKRGILFSEITIDMISPRIIKLPEKSGFDSVLEFFAIIHELSVSMDIKFLSNSSFTSDQMKYDSRRIEKVFEYLNCNFNQQVTLSDVAKIANMSEVSFSRFIKRHTGYSFIDSLNEIRLGHVSRMLIDTNQTVAEVAFKCGFNNMANFNRIFKSKKGLTPKEFRKNYDGKRIII
jgi:AraC-like DNA-binding protein